jgi:hypothetical protein
MAILRKAPRVNVEEITIMDRIETLREQIAKTRVILAESQENYEKNPESYSARLLLMSTEGYLTDLLKELDALQREK